MLARERKLLILALVVMDKVKNKLQKDYQLLFQRVWTMEPELDFQEKEKLDQEVPVVVIYTYLLMFTLMTYLRDQMKIYFLSYDHPRVLMVLVDRYTQSSSYSRSRRDCRVIEMDNILDLHGQRYKLSGIVKHLGTSVDSGHYIGCKRISFRLKWWRHDYG